MSNVNPGFRLNMTYQGSQVQLNPQQAGIDPTASSTSDQVLDLNVANLAAELQSQKLDGVTAIKIGNKFILAPDHQTLHGLVDQLKSLCLNEDGALRRDFKNIELGEKRHQAHGDHPTTTKVTLNVLGPEPDDGYEGTNEYIREAHLVRPGDTLTDLARHYYGEENLAEIVHRLGHFNELADPNRILAGQVLYFPEPELLALYQEPNQPAALAPSGANGGGALNSATVPSLDSAAAPLAPVSPRPATAGPNDSFNGPMTADGLIDFMGSVGLDFLISAEGTRNRAYRDSVGKWTIGVGHLIRLPAERELLNKSLSQDEVRQLLMRDLRRHIQPLIENIKPEVLQKLNRNQITALASLAFNIGPGGIVDGKRRGFKYSPVVEALNRPGDYNQNLSAAAAAFDRHAYAGGRRLGALTNRRESERLLMLGAGLNPAAMPIYDARALAQVARAQGIGLA